MRPKDAPNYLLCEICWLMETDEGNLQMGLQALPGVPHPLAVRAAGQKVQSNEAYIRAFILPCRLRAWRAIAGARASTRSR